MEWLVKRSRRFRVRTLSHNNFLLETDISYHFNSIPDFLVYALDSDSLLGHWAIAVFDEASGEQC